MVSIPSTPLSMNTYIDENALQPAQVCTIEMVSASFIFLITHSCALRLTRTGTGVMFTPPTDTLSN